MTLPEKITKPHLNASVIAGAIVSVYASVSAGVIGWRLRQRIIYQEAQQAICKRM
jgi:hypothetical protein